MSEISALKKKKKHGWTENLKAEQGNEWSHFIVIMCVCWVQKRDWIIRLFFNEMKRKNETKCTRNEEREIKKQMEIDTMFSMLYLKSHYKVLSSTTNPSKIYFIFDQVIKFKEVG